LSKRLDAAKNRCTTLGLGLACKFPKTSSKATIVVVFLCRIAVTTKGKYTALEAEAIDPLVELVSDPDSEVRTYALKVVFHEPV